MSFSDISDFENLIRSGTVSASQQRELECRIRSNPSLARATDEFETTLLMIAAGAGNIAATQLLCELAADVNALNQCGETPLINVVRESENENSLLPEELQARLKIIDCLASHGANPNTLGAQGCSALHTAIIYGQVKFVDHLLRAGADPEVCLDDPPDDDKAAALALSSRFRGSETQRTRIINMLAAHKHGKAIQIQETNDSRGTAV